MQDQLLWVGNRVPLVEEWPVEKLTGQKMDDILEKSIGSCLQELGKFKSQLPV